MDDATAAPLPSFPSTGAPSLAAETSASPSIAVVQQAQVSDSSSDDESEIPNYNTVRRLTLWVLVAIGIACVMVLVYSARQWTKLLKRGIIYVHILFNLSKVAILVYSVQKPTSGPSTFALSFIMLVTKLQETLALFDSSALGGAAGHSAVALSLCAAGTFIIYCISLVCLAVPTISLATLLWLNAGTMLVDCSIAGFVVKRLDEQGAIAAWKLRTYVVVQTVATTGSVALASYASASGSNDVRLPLCDALVFVVATAASQLFLEANDAVTGDRQGKASFNIDTSTTTTTNNQIYKVDRIPSLHV